MVTVFSEYYLNRFQIFHNQSATNKFIIFERVDYWLVLKEANWGQGKQNMFTFLTTAKMTKVYNFIIKVNIDDGGDWQDIGHILVRWAAI